VAGGCITIDHINLATLSRCSKRDNSFKKNSTVKLNPIDFVNDRGLD